MDERDIANQSWRLSAELNGVFVKADNLESALARYAVCLVETNDHPVFRVILSGSATGIRYRDQYVMIASQHQLAETDISRIGIFVSDGKYVVTSAGAVWYTVDKESDARDVVAFDYNEPCLDIPEIRSRFFVFDRIPPQAASNQVVAILVFGYVAKEQLYELEDLNRISLSPRVVICHPWAQPTDHAILTVRATKPLPIHPDGMSGGPAFVVQIDNGRPRVDFAGLVVRGGVEYFHILKAGYISHFLDSFVETRLGGARR